MNIKRAIAGPLLSLVFLFVFVYMLSGIQWIFNSLPQVENGQEFLGSVSGGVENIVADDTIIEPDLEIDAQSAISVCVNSSGSSKNIFSINGQRKLSVASISKLMTALVVVENYNLSQEIKVSNDAINQSEDPELLKVGETFNAEDLLYAMLVGSDNAASYVFSELIGTDKFVELMNAKAQELGLFYTSFLNSTGLGLANFSTVEDLVKLTKYILEKYPIIFEITTISEFNLNTFDGKISHKIINTNKLLNESAGLSERIIGGKTGETRSAGGCLLLVVSSPSSENYLINIILNSKDRFGETKKMINWSDLTCK